MFSPRKEKKKKTGRKEWEGGREGRKTRKGRKERRIGKYVAMWGDGDVNELE